MVESAKLAAEQEVRKAKSILKNEAVGLAVGMAESLIREKINEDGPQENCGGLSC